MEKKGNIFSRSIKKNTEPESESQFDELKSETDFDELIEDENVVDENVVVDENIGEEVVENKIVENGLKSEPKEDIFINTFHDPNLVKVENLQQDYEKVNIIDLVNITQEYDVILPTVPGKTDSVGNNNMFIKTPPSKPIKGKNIVFKDFNLSIKDVKKRGQFFALLGKSGCGKSTILRYICGLQKPTAGDIYLYGKKLKKNNHIPMVFQQYSSFPWKSVLDNVALPLLLQGVHKKEARERAMEMIKIVGLDGHQSKWAKYPILSGGQLQRVAIARNLVANPTILLMDEPFGALDTVTRRSMQLFLRQIFQDNNGLDPTVVLVTHEIHEAVFLSTDILIMDANPATVRCHIEIDLPSERPLSLKRDPRFLEHVNYIDDFMDKLDKETK